MKLAKAAVLAGMLVVMGGFSAFNAPQAESAQIRIGQLDIQRVYQAYPGAPGFQAEAQRIQMEFQQAQEAGDQQKMMEIQQKFQARQETFHRKFESDLREATKAVSESENVQMIVAEVIYHTDDVETVDVSVATIEEMNGEVKEPEPVSCPQP